MDTSQVITEGAAGAPRDDRYPFAEIEPKWQKRWEEADLFRAHDQSEKPKFYSLDFFPYPSGAGLSVGHCRNYIPTDAAARYMSMKGYNVLHPMGWDAFGQPAENEAIKRGRHPREMVEQYADTYRRQMKLIGISYDWSREVNSSAPDFYKWTQWFFLYLYRRGLAYRKHAPTNWCPSCKTGLANEEVKLGLCWRCSTVVEKRPMPQWFFKITDYADRLIDDLDTVSWPEGIKRMQKEWIGRSEGAEVDFEVDGSDEKIRIFTTRPDTLYGATFMVLAPEHPLVDQVTSDAQRDAVKQYRDVAARATEMDRMSTERKKTGVFTGGHAINPLNNERIPIWVADYVLMGYGTGAIMCVPAHDQRDFEFARQFALPIRLVYSIPGRRLASSHAGVDGAEEDELTQAVEHGGHVINSGPFNGMAAGPDVVPAFVKHLEAHGQGTGKVNYRLRDWLISRQRYWGAPIPIIHCPADGEVAVPDDQLPVTLPDVEKYQPSGTGESPLATIPDFVNTTCPKCGGPARRETDTMGGFACSSWYFLRFADPHNDKAAFDRDKSDYWLPVDLYVGGAEHAVMHLLYARFWTKAMFDGGLIAFKEPFQTLRNQGMLLAWTPGRAPQGDEHNEEADESILDWIVLKPEERDAYPPEKIIFRWAKMSKSMGNVVTPDEMAAQYGADVLRLYELFVAPFEDTVQWSSDGLNGAARWINRLWRLYRNQVESFDPAWRDRTPAATGDDDMRVRRKLHQTLRKLTDDLATFRFNVGIAAMMELVNEVYASREKLQKTVMSEVLETLALMLAPLTPHLADELWERLGKQGFTYRAPWPSFDAEIAKEPSLEIVVQVNGKLRDRLHVPAGTANAELERQALASEKVQAALEGRHPRKVIVVPDKLVNIVG